MDDHEELSWTQSGDFRDPVAECNFILANRASVMQTPVELSQIPRALSRSSDSVMASGRSGFGCTSASGYGSLEKFATLEFGVNVESLHHPNQIVDTEEVQAAFVTGTGAIGSKTTVDNDWNAKRPEIYKHYMVNRHPLPEVMAIMKKSGFEATESMYKKRFKKWGWKKYQGIKDYAKPGIESSMSESCASELCQEAKATPTCTANDENSITGGSSCDTAVIVGREIVLGSPKTIQQTDLHKYAVAIISHVRSLYIGSIEQGKWQVKNQFLVEEDIYDDLLVGVASAIQNFQAEENHIGGMGIMKAFKTLERVVTDCGLFSLPIIWESVVRMIRRGHNKLAKIFLVHTLELAIGKAGYGKNHPFVQAITGLLWVNRVNPHMLEQVILRVYRSCVEHVIQKLSSSHLTTLSLWGDFVVYVDNSSASETKEALDGFRHVMRKSEEDNGVDDDFTLEILGLTLYVLQSTESTAAEAEQVALDMLRRVNRRVQNGEKLEGTLLVMWKDLKHALGNFCYANGELRAAVMHIEDRIILGIVDDRDIFALKCLEEWYSELGELSEAERVRKFRISSSERLFQEDKTELAEGEEVEKENEDGEDIDRDGYESTDEDEDFAEYEDAEEEMKKLKGQINKLEQKMSRLQKKVEERKEKETMNFMEDESR